MPPPLTHNWNEVNNQEKYIDTLIEWFTQLILSNRAVTESICAV